MALGPCRFLFFFFFFFLSLICSRSSLHGAINPTTTVYPTNPTTAPPVTNPPVIIMPPNPSSTPVTIPSTTPVIVPPNPPVTAPGTVTVPGGGGAQPVTNPVTSYPTPAGNVPVVAPPAVPDAPAIQGLSWCVARNGASEPALQAALDYACGTGGVDCSQIQQGGSCYSPNSLQNHASYAFNSYYRKNPSALSCDFGGTAIIVGTNPSSGSCTYSSSSSSSSPLPPSSPPSSPSPSSPPPSSPSPSSSSSSSLPTAPGTTTPTPSTQTVTPPVTTTPISGGVLGSATPPPVLNPVNPASSAPTNPASGTTAVYGFDGAPTASTSTPSVSSRLQILIGFSMLVTSTIAGTLVLQI